MSISISLPNGKTVFGLSHDDTLGIYQDIFEDRCYDRFGISVNDGDCILDIGANTGLFMVYLNSICKSAKVYAFEPVPAIFGVLCYNLHAHNHLDTEVFNVGLSNKPGHADFFYYPRFSQASTMYPDNSPETIKRDQDYLMTQAHALRWPLPFLLSFCPTFLLRILAERFRRYYLSPQRVICKLWTLSDFIRLRKIERIDLLKIDAEQCEHDILAGLDEEHWPIIRQVIVEVHQGELATEKIVELLEEHGYMTTTSPNPAMPGLSLVYAVTVSEEWNKEFEKGADAHQDIRK